MSLFVKPHFGLQLAHSDRPLTNELLPGLKDGVFQWHFQNANDFCRLDEESLLRAEIAPTKHKATQVLNGAHKSGMIDAQTGRPNTAKVDKNMVHNMPVLGGISKQREFVMLLFFWEEEISRWRSLEVQEQELQEKLRELDLSDNARIELEEAVKMVQARKGVLPSRRDQSGNPIHVANEQLPRYDDSQRTG